MARFAVSGTERSGKPRDAYFFELWKFTYCLERYWLAAVTKLPLKSVLRGHKSA